MDTRWFNRSSSECNHSQGVTVLSRKDWLTESLTIIFMLNWKYYDEELAKIIKNWQKLSKKWLKWWKTGENDEKLAKMMKNWQKLWKTGKKWWQCWFPQECFRVFSKDEEGCIPADEIKWGWIIFNIILSNRPQYFFRIARSILLNH